MLVPMKPNAHHVEMGVLNVNYVLHHAHFQHLIRHVLPVMMDIIYNQMEVINGSDFLTSI